ncbi:hypothetical protein GCM10007874_18420 [Labrys miyagiensis]|uniref:Uncharacterized protein n=1 Tax=Labrys miyagiensis TaxID=346912 RepID=A0ABQ6CFX3_9HYPH|nr:hypothetical protein GCM10007874_18420 [Labrys miyagiensis]
MGSSGRKIGILWWVEEYKSPRPGCYRVQADHAGRKGAGILPRLRGRWTGEAGPEGGEWRDIPSFG